MASSSSRTTVIGADITVKDNNPIRRPEFGRLGRKITVRTNFFRMRAPQLHEIVQYSIAIDAERFPKGVPTSNPANKVLTDITPTAITTVNRSIVAAWCRSQKIRTPLAFDGRKIAYSPVELDNRFMCGPMGDKKFPFVIDCDGVVDASNPPRANVRTETVWFRIAKANVIDCRPLLSRSNHRTLDAGPALAAIDAVLAVGPLKTHVQVGRSFYHETDARSLQDGVEAWKGFYQSTRLSMSGLLVNMDESRTPFWSSGGRPLEALLQECRLTVAPGSARNSRADNRRAGKMLHGLKVKAIHNKIVYRIHGFSDKNVFEAYFMTAENEQKSIAEYFQSTYGRRLTRGDLPCVITNPKKNTLMPMEVLIVQDKQRLTKSLTPIQTSNMIKCAATPPTRRAEGAAAAMQRVDHNRDPTCNGFGISVDKQLMNVNARILPPPIIQYAGNAIDKPDRGAWNNRHQKPLVLCAPVNTWAVLNLSYAKEPQVKSFVSNLCRSAGSMGFKMNSNPRHYHNNDRNVERALRKIKDDFDNPAFRVNNFPLQLILIIKNKQDTETYNIIKRMTDIEFGIASQCMLVKHIQPRQQTYYGNLLLKINSKLGGTNFASRRNVQTPEVPFAVTPHIILGADVTHPAGGGARPSVAALVGSKNRDCSQFTGSIRNMKPRQELMDEMGDMFLEVYRRWFEEMNKKNRPGQKPVHAESIIMFRDGVSEGQFQQILDVELMGIRRACEHVKRDWNPKVTFVICTKRHHARFFPMQRNDGDNKMNCLPGTVIDTGIVSEQYYDFYLNSHAGIQGTSRPSKYTVLIDENNCTVDALQAYIYRLAHGYVRCNRAVSIVNSAYYAHLLAFRGRAYLGEDGSDTASVTTENSTVPATVPLHPKLGKRLFFV